MQKTGSEMACLAEDSVRTLTIRLFFVTASVQTVAVTFLADSGSVHNLINKAHLRKLPIQPPVLPVGDVQVLGDNRHTLNLREFAVLPTTIRTIIFWH